MGEEPHFLHTDEDDLAGDRIGGESVRQ